MNSSSGFKPSDSDLEALGLLSGGNGDRRRPVTLVGQGRHLPIEAGIRLQCSVPMTQALRAQAQTWAALGSLPTKSQRCELISGPVCISLGSSPATHIFCGGQTHSGPPLTASARGTAVQT